MNQNYTIKDVAKLAGVSKGTVDRVIHKRGRVSEETTKTVMEVMAQLDYKPNPIAKSLKRNKVYIISILLPTAVNDPYWAPCNKAISEIEKEFGHFGVKLNRHLFDSEITESFVSAGLDAIKTKPDAILMAPMFNSEAEDIAKKCAEEDIKIATFNNYLKNGNVNLLIGQNLYQSGRIAASLFCLVLPPNATIAILHIDESFQNASHMQEKEKGFTDYLDQEHHGLYNVQVHNLKKEYSLTFTETIENFFKENQKLEGMFVTTSKTHLLADHFIKCSRKPFMIGYDLIDDNIKHLKNKNIAFLIHQDPKKQIYLALTYLIEHFLFENPLKNQLSLPIDIVNAENYKEYLG